jgi:hypothetical protein
MESRTRWLARLMTAALACAAASAARADDQDDHPVPVPDGAGGYSVTFAARHFLELQSGAVQDDVFVVPREPFFRPCVLTTPKTPVFHDRGRVDVQIELQARWVGFLDLRLGEEGDLFTTFVGVAHGADVRTRRDFFHTGLLLKQVDYVGEDGRSHLVATTGGFTHDYAVSGTSVERDDEVSVRICDVRPGTAVSVKSITIHTYPTGG